MSLPGLRSGRVALVLPPELDVGRALLTAEIGELEAALRCVVEICDADPRCGSRWLFETAEVAAPELTWDSAEQVIRSRASDVNGWFRTLSLLHPLVRGHGAGVSDSPTVDRSAVFDKVSTEIAGSFPALGRRFDWPAICRRHRDDVVDGPDLLVALQRMVAELRDVHTWVRPAGPVTYPPYAVSVAGDVAELIKVPPGTAAHASGVRGGWRLLDEHPLDWVARSGAPPHAAALIAGRRLIAVQGESRRFRAAAPDGREASWTELPQHRSTVVQRLLDDGSGYLRVDSWTDPEPTDQAIDVALQEFQGLNRLVLDLRGNTGGNLVLATRTRDRFLRDRTALGAIRYSDGRAGLSESRPLVGTPLDDGQRWTGDLVVLIDGLTCSSSEDFLLGLHGLPYVRTVGSPTCGGSGRPRSVTLTADLTLSVSTALTYDRTGRCIEGNGVPADRPASAGPAGIHD